MKIEIRTAAPAPRPAGITLTEIMISIMILGIGLISLATLFPLACSGSATPSARRARPICPSRPPPTWRRGGCYNKDSFVYADLLNAPSAFPLVSVAAQPWPPAATTRSRTTRPLYGTDAYDATNPSVASSSACLRAAMVSVRL